MANELEIVYPTAGATIYVTIRRHSDAKVFNTSTAAYETWSDGSIANYDVALTDKGGDLYQGNMPAGVTADRLRITWYLQAGGTPAITDQILASLDLTYDGAALASASTVTLSSNALVSLEQVKRQLRLTSSTYDTHLTELINAVTAQIERYTGRGFKARDYRQWLSSRVWAFSLPNYPLINVRLVAEGCANALEVSYTGSALRAVVSVLADAVELHETQTDATNTLTFASYGTTDALATAINALSGWSATKRLDAPTDELIPGEGQDAKSHTAYLSWPDDHACPRRVDSDTGTIHFSAYTHNGVGRKYPRLAASITRLVKYRGGYETIPDDLAYAAAEIVATSYKRAALNLAVQSESLGDWSYSLATNEETAKMFTDRLAGWKRPVLAGGVR